MAQIITDDRRDSVVVNEQEPETVQREPVRGTSVNIGGIIVALLVLLLLVYLLRGAF